MSNIVINDLPEMEILGEKSMARIQGGYSVLYDPTGDPSTSPEPAPIKLFDPFPTYDAEKFKDELLARIGSMPSTPEPLPGTDPLGGPY